MTFARRAKEELMRLNLTKLEQLAELSALLHLQGEIEITNKGIFLNFESTSIATTRHFVKLIKDLYQADVELYVKQSSFNKKKTSAKVITQVQNIITEHSLLDENINEYRLIIKTNEQKQAYLRGAFIASGSISDPVKPNYHFEVFTNSKVEAVFIQSLLNEYNLNAKLTRRRNGLIIYIKEAEAISEFLKIIGAYEAVFAYENARIQRDFNNAINRLMNIEISNEKKTLRASKQQQLYIRFIKQYRDINLLDDRLQEVIKLREENPEASLNELREIYEYETGNKISKSGINHRLNKLKEMAFDIAKQLKDN